MAKGKIALNHRMAEWQAALKHLPADRKLPPLKDLNPFAASPVGDKAEYACAWRALRQSHPALQVRYIGTDGELHYFQEWGDPIAYIVPVSEGWKVPR